MLGRRNTAELAPPIVELQPEEESRLVAEAQARIETVEGVDYLDGYNLPPDDEEIWNPRTLRAHITHMVEKDGRWAVWEEEYEYDSELTNSWIRDVNVRTIATSGCPLFRTWEEIMPDMEKVRAQQKAQRDEKYANSWRGRVGRLLFGHNRADTNQGVDSISD